MSFKSNVYRLIIDHTSFSTWFYNNFYFVSVVIKRSYEVMNNLEKLSKTVTDILDCRVEAVLQEMSVTALCDLPEDDAVTMEKFLELTTDVVEGASKTLAT